MLLLHRPTHPILSPLVNCLWYFSGRRATRELALPTGTTELVINLRASPMRIFREIDDRDGQRFDRGVVCGTHSRYFVLDGSTDGAVAGVHFRPGGALPFLGMPLSELTDQHVSLDEIWGTRAKSLSESLAEEKTPAGVLQSLERELLSRLSERATHHPAVAFALTEFSRAPTIARIHEVSKGTGYSDKRFIRLFTDGIGLGPKRFCRVLRLQAVVSQLARGERVEWATLAAESGYYDQSHLIRDFRSMTGLTPAQYQPVNHHSPNHVAI